MICNLGDLMSLRHPVWILCDSDLQSNEPNIRSKELYIHAKEPSILSKEPYIHSYIWVNTHTLNQMYVYDVWVFTQKCRLSEYSYIIQSPIYTFEWILIHLTLIHSWVYVHIWVNTPTSYTDTFMSEYSYTWVCIGRLYTQPYLPSRCEKPSGYRCNSTAVSVCVCECVGVCMWVCGCVCAIDVRALSMYVGL